jgi:hypothetical protein
MKEYQFKLFEHAINTGLLYQEEFDDLLNVKEDTDLNTILVDINTEFDFDKVPIYSWGKRIKKPKDKCFKRLRYFKKHRFENKHDVEIERLLTEIGTQWKKMTQVSFILKPFDRKQLKERARTIKKKRTRENVDIGIFNLVN